ISAEGVRLIPEKLRVGRTQDGLHNVFSGPIIVSISLDGQRVLAGKIPLRPEPGSSRIPSGRLRADSGVVEGRSLRVFRVRTILTGGSDRAAIAGAHDGAILVSP